jgi:hypothetical protein
MEEFFENPKLNHLFNFFADEIKARGHHISAKRRTNKSVPDKK